MLGVCLVGLTGCGEVGEGYGRGSQEERVDFVAELWGEAEEGRFCLRVCRGCGEERWLGGILALEADGWFWCGGDGGCGACRCSTWMGVCCPRRHCSLVFSELVFCLFLMVFRILWEASELLDGLRVLRILVVSM